MKRKILITIIMVTLTLSFVGCKEKNEPEKNPKVQLNTSLDENESTKENAISEQTDIEGSHADAVKANHNTAVSEDFLMQIEDTFTITGRGIVAYGKILSGFVSANAEVELVGLADNSRTVKVGTIEILRKLVDTANTGDSAGILLSGLERGEVGKGQFLAAKGSFSSHNTFSAKLKFMEGQTDNLHKSGNMQALCYFYTTDSNSTIYFDDKNKDANGFLTVKAKLLSKLLMKEGTPFEVRRDGVVIASGEVTGVDVDIDPVRKTDANSNEQPKGGNTVVTLKSSGVQKIQVIKEIRSICKLGLAEAKALVDNVPTIIKENISKEEAELIKSKLEKLGATVEIKELTGE